MRERAAFERVALFKIVEEVYEKQIVLLGFFLLIFSLHADSYYKEEGRLEDGTRYIKEA